MQKRSVPLERQGKLDCGPTALKMVFQFFGEKVSKKEIIQKAGGIKEFGFKTIKLAEVAQGKGFRVYCYSYNKKLSEGKAEIRKPAKKDLVKFLKEKLPVIIAVRKFILYNEKPCKAGHFIVITKYENKKFWYNDPSDGKQHQIKEEKLMRAWQENALDSSAHLLALKPKKRIIL